MTYEGIRVCMYVCVCVCVCVCIYICKMLLSIVTFNIVVYTGDD